LDSSIIIDFVTIVNFGIIVAVDFDSSRHQASQQNHLS